jgi:hypothetical protein
MKKLLPVLVFLFPLLLFGQVPDAGQLLGLISVTSAEKNAIVGPTDGMILYDTDETTIYSYSVVYGWQKHEIGPSVYVGSFIINGDGNHVVSGIPFKPSQITFTAHANIEDINIDSDNGVGNNTQGLQNSFGSMTGFARDDNGTTAQQVIFSGGHGNSINDISRYSSSSHCIGIRFGHQNGDDLGKILASFTSFDTNGFTINAEYLDGTLTGAGTTTTNTFEPSDVDNETLLVLYTAYR